MPPLTDHFDESEFEHGGAAVPAQYLPNLYALAALLETARAIGGGYPLQITSGYRPPADNAAVGGSSTSQHMTASAADFYPVGVDMLTWARVILAAANAGQIRFGQMEIDPWGDGHVHLSLDNGAHVNQALVLVGTNPNRYAVWDGGDVPPKGSGGVGDAIAATDAAESTASTTPVSWLIIAGMILYLLHREGVI
jgi:peptidase M15-like protein